MHHTHRHDAAQDAHDRHLFGTALQTVALGALVWHAFELVRGTHQRRVSTTPEAPPPRVQTWEGEGGNVDPDEAGVGSTG